MREPHRERDYLRPAEVPVYLAACSDFWRPRALTLILTGVRVGELVALEWGDIDWHGSAVIVRRALKRDGIGSTKGDETGRRVDMGPRLTEALRDLHARQAELTVGDVDLGLVFPAPGGGYDDPGRLLDEHRAALKRAGLRLSLRNHELRHTAAAVWLSLGFGLEYVRRQMGHRQITTTINAYGHHEGSMIPAAAARAEAAILGTETGRGGSPLGTPDLKEGDSNSRSDRSPIPDFQSGAFNHSAILPRNGANQPQKMDGTDPVIVS